MYCLQCNKETINPKFCSSSCNAKYYNKAQRRSKPKGKCKVCDTPITNNNTFCKEHRIKYFDWDTATIEQAQERHKHQFYNRIRELARRRYQKQFRIFACQNCGYDKFVEICHIHAISSFSKDTLVSVVNTEENIVLLCPNCHWEFDNDLLDIGKKNISYLSKVDYKDCICRTCKRSLERQPNHNKKIPPKEQLEEDLKTLNKSAIARKYGVADKTVRKWIVKYGLD